MSLNIDVRQTHAIRTAAQKLQGTRAYGCSLRLHPRILPPLLVPGRTLALQKSCNKANDPGVWQVMCQNLVKRRVRLRRL